MYDEEILSFAREALGKSGSDGVLTGLCKAAGGEMLARLKEGVAAEDIKESFVTAAGVLALSMYMALEEGRLAGEVKAGSLSVKRSGGAVSADGLRKQAEAILAAYLEDRGFAFLGVRG